MSYPFAELNLSYSSRGLLKACQRKFEFKKTYLIGKHEESLAGEVGKALHIGVQEFLSYRDKERAILAFMLAYPIHLCVNHMDTRSLEAGYVTLEAIMDHVKFDQYEIVKIKHKGIDKPAVEVPFKINIKGFDLKNEKGEEVKLGYRGFIDIILFNVVEGFYEVWDIKTTQSNKPRDQSVRYNFDEQQVPYGLVLEYLLGNKIESFSVKYLVAFIDTLSPTIQIHSYQKTIADLQDWFKGVIMDLNDIKFFIDENWWPRNAKSCMNQYNQKCEFFDLCETRDRDAIQRMLRAEDEEYELDEALFNKAGLANFDPWVEFDMDVAA